jgi:hypothetical protein
MPDERRLLRFVIYLSLPIVEDLSGVVLPGIVLVAEGGQVPLGWGILKTSSFLESVICVV